MIRLIAGFIVLICWSEVGFVFLRKFGRLAHWLIAVGGAAAAVVLLTEPLVNLPHEPEFVMACGGAIVFAVATTTLATQILAKAKCPRAVRVGVTTCTGVASLIAGFLIGGIIWLAVWQPHK